MAFGELQEGWLSWHRGKDLCLVCSLKECGLHWRGSVDLLLALSPDRQLRGLRGLAARHAGCIREGLGKGRCLALLEITPPPRRYAEVPFKDPGSRRALKEVGTMKIGDFQDWHMLFGVCRVCNRVYFVDRHKLARRFSADCLLEHLATRLRCKACRNREGNAFAITMAPR